MVNQVLHCGIFEIVSIIQPQGIGKQGSGFAIVAVQGVPDMTGLGTQGCDAVSTQQILNLLARLTAGDLSQHGQSQI